MPHHHQHVERRSPAQKSQRFLLPSFVQPWDQEWLLGPVLPACITVQVPWGRLGPGTLGSVNGPSSKSFSSLTFCSPGLSWISPACLLLPPGDLIFTLNGFGQPRSGCGGEFRTGFAPFLSFLGFVNGSQTLNAILMQLFCVWIMCSFCQTSNPGTKIS